MDCGWAFWPIIWSPRKCRYPLVSVHIWGLGGSSALTDCCWLILVRADHPNFRKRSENSGGEIFAPANSESRSENCSEDSLRMGCNSREWLREWLLFSGPQKGPTSENGKNHQKVSSQISTLVAQRKKSEPIFVGTGDATKHFPVEKKGFSVKRGVAIQ